jgi:hypothetical protein
MPQRGDEAPHGKNRKTRIDYRAAAIAIRPPAERDLQDRLRETVRPDRDADESKIAARPTLARSSTALMRSLVDMGGRLSGLGFARKVRYINRFDYADPLETES